MRYSRLYLTLFFVLFMQFGFSKSLPTSFQSAPQPSYNVFLSAILPKQDFAALLSKQAELAIYQNVNGIFQMILSKNIGCEHHMLEIVAQDQSSKAAQNQPQFITILCKNTMKVHKFSPKDKTLFSIQENNEAFNKKSGNVRIQRRLLPFSCSTQKVIQLNGVNTTVCGDNNRDNNDGCSSDCKDQFCGDGIKQNDEQCDDGNNQKQDGCDQCRIELCGNKIVDIGQECDDGNKVDDDQCNNKCVKNKQSAAIPLAIGVPIAGIAIVGLLIGKFAISSGAVGAQALGSNAQNTMLDNIENTAKIINTNPNQMQIQS